MRRPRYTDHARPILWLVPPGRLEREVGPAHELDAFYISKQPVTNLQYAAFAPDFVRAAESPSDDDPAVGISCGQAEEYARWYGELSGKPTRLPTEVEWEYACRGGSPGRHYFEDVQRMDDHVWHAGNSGSTVPSLPDKPANPFGLLAMLGGVWEWTSLGVARGGSWRTEPGGIDCSARRELPAGGSDVDLGFRIVREFRRSAAEGSAITRGARGADLR